MSHLARVLLSDLTPRQLQWIDKATRHTYDGESTRELLERIRDTNMDLWQYTGEHAEGVAGTVFLNKAAGKELWIEFFAGEGLIKEARTAYEAFLEIARLFGAKRISFFAVRPGLAKLYRDVVQVPAAATLFSEEV